jgi:hypothetical protein
LIYVVLRIKLRRMIWVGHITQMGDKKKACRILVRKPERKSLLRRPRNRWVDNIKVGLRAI